MSAEVVVAEIDLEDLEVAAALLGPAGTFRHEARSLAETFAAQVREAVDAGHRIAIVGRGAKRMAPSERWRLPLAETPQPWRSQAAAAMAAVVGRHRVRLDRIEYLL